MKDFLINCLESLVKNENVLKTYKDLANFFNTQNLTLGYVTCLEKIWYIERKSELLLEISDICINKLNNSELSSFFKALYFYDYSPILFVDLLKTLDVKENFINKIENEYKKSEFNLLINRGLICISIINFLIMKKDFDFIMKAINIYLQQIENQILEFLKQNNIKNSLEFDNYMNDKKNLSFALSNIEHHNDINNLAISINSDNKKAYINILEDLLVYKKFEEAKIFYNNKICTKFSNKQTDNLEDICWLLSLEFSAQYDFYKALYFQKLAVEFGINNSNQEV